MSTLTKVCIVVLVLLCVVAVPIFINVATIVPNYRKAMEDERNQKVLANQQDHVTQGALWAERAGRDADNRASSEKVAGLRRSFGEKAAELQTALLANIRLQSSLDAQTEVASASQARLKAAQTTTDQLIAQITAQRQELTQKDQDILSLRKAKEEAEAESARNQQITRSVREELAAAVQRIADQTKKIEDLQAGRQVTAGSEVKGEAPRILGTITSVSGNLASINIGRTQGIDKNMKLVIFRGSEYVATLQIEMVELDHAAGVVVDKKHTPMVNDKVTSKLP